MQKCYQEFPLIRHSMQIPPQPCQSRCELSALCHPRSPLCSGLAGAALLPCNSNVGFCTEQQPWFSCHWLRSGTRSLKGKPEDLDCSGRVWTWAEKQKSGLECIPVPIDLPCTCAFQLCGIKHQRKAQRASKIQHSKAPKLQNGWNWTTSAQPGKMMLKLNPAFVAAVNWTTVAVLCTQLKSGLKTTPQHESLSDNSENLQHWGVNF